MQRITNSIYVDTKTGRLRVPFGKAYFIDRGSNPGCIITDEGLVQIDTTKNPMFALKWKEELRNITSKKFAYVVNTDHHLDHILCNYCFPGTVIAHELSALEVMKFVGFQPQKLIPFMYSKELYAMLQSRDESYLHSLLASFRKLDKEIRKLYENLRIIPPRITFSEKITLEMGNKTLELTHVGGHAPGSILVYVREDKVLFAGDSVFNDLLPNMAQANTARWLQVLKRIQDMEVATIVPGHGHPCGKEALKKLAGYIEEVRDNVKVLREKGCSKDEVVAKVNLTTFFPVNEKLGWTKARIRDWSKDNVARVFDELESKGSNPS